MLQRLSIAPVVEKTDLVRSRGLQGRHTEKAALDRWRGSMRNGRNRRKWVRATTREESRVAHRSFNQPEFPVFPAALF